MSAEFRYLSNKMRDAGLPELADETDHHRTQLERRGQLPPRLSTPGRAPAGYVDLYIKLRQRGDLRRAAIRTKRFIKETVFPMVEVSQNPALQERLIGASNRDKLRHALVTQNIAHPGELIILKPFADALGITNERGRQIYNELLKEGIELPILKARGDYQQFLKSIQLINEGHNVVTAAKALNIDRHRLLSLIHLFVEGNVTDLTTAPATSAIAKRREELQQLLEAGTPTPNVLTKLDTTRHKLSHDRKVLQEEGKAIRQRKKRVMGQALVDRRAQIKPLFDEGLQYAEIAKRTGIPLFDVEYDIKVMIKAGEIRKRR